MMVIVAACLSRSVVPITGALKRWVPNDAGWDDAGRHPDSRYEWVSCFGTVMLSNAPKLGDFLVDPKA